MTVPPRPPATRHRTVTCRRRGAAPDSTERVSGPVPDDAGHVRIGVFDHRDRPGKLRRVRKRLPRGPGVFWRRVWTVVWQRVPVVRRRRGRLLPWEMFIA